MPVEFQRRHEQPAVNPASGPGARAESIFNPTRQLAGESRRCAGSM
jgi:hypothetical protein